MEFLAGIGGITLVIIAFYLIFSHYDHQSAKAEENRQLIYKGGYSYEFERFWQSHPELSHERALLKFLEDEGKKKKVMNQAQERVQFDKELEAEIKRDRIKKRVFAYSYENFIFSLFSPLAKKKKGSYNTDEWRCSDSLPKTYVLKKMEEKYGADVTQLYEQFLENELLWDMKDGSIRLGFILQHNHNVVIDTDLNIDKYIKQFGQRCSYAELQAEISSIIAPKKEQEESLSTIRKKQVSFTLQEMQDKYGRVTIGRQSMLRPDGSEFVVYGLKFGNEKECCFAAFSSRIADGNQELRDIQFQGLNGVEIGKKVWGQKDNFVVVHKRDSKTGELLYRQSGEPICTIYHKSDI